ncbi:MAG: 2-phospho-L-lactate transferase CofD family protein, partial [Aeromicrobium sp.]
MKITVLSGGVGGARFLRGLRAAAPSADITAVVNVGDDMWLTGLRIAPDLDSIMYTLAGENDEQRGWGRVGETERVSAELRAYGVGWPWFTLGDLDLGTHLARTAWLREGATPSQVATRLQARWPLGVRLIPATDTEVDTYVRVADADELDGERELHFQEWWTRYRAALPAIAF